MSKLLVICGPTAVGKTKLALTLAVRFGGELISADSRQVYRGLDIGTGKDLSLLGSTPLWGVDLVDPRKNFSVFQYLKAVQVVMADIRRRNKLPILVGGTGFYVKAVVDGIPTIEIPQNRRIRSNLSQKSAAELYEVLSQLDSLKAASMNLSDRGNKRRLVRAIEIAQWKIGHSTWKPADLKDEKLLLLMIGLTAPVDYLEKNIIKRTQRMLRQGVITEIKKLLNCKVSWKNQAMNTIGYKEWRDYFKGSSPKEKVVAMWLKNQLNYAKEQLLWFKKDRRVQWFNISEKGYEKKLVNLVEKWYKKGSD